jgi:hypothetical protein
MEHLQRFVSSRGILKSCQLHNRMPQSSCADITFAPPDNFAARTSLYVCTDALGHFSSQVIDRIGSPFTLVSGDSDMSVSPRTIGEREFHKILDNENLIAWYAQNLAATHDKLRHLPIGLDYHTMWEKKSTWGLTRISPFAQETTLVVTLVASPPTAQRFLEPYCNWQFDLGRGERESCFNTIDRSICFFEKSLIPRGSCWARQSQFMFVVSPGGVGNDCHRTWEALILGCIPIVKRDEVTPLFVDLPVIVVEDWRELSRSFLVDSFQRLSQRKFRYSSLFLEHWRRAIAGSDADTLEEMTMADFRSLMTRTTA